MRNVIMSTLAGLCLSVCFSGPAIAQADRDPKADAANGNAADTNAADTKAADTKAADTKAADTKAADTKAADTKAADTDAADTEPRRAETRPEFREPEADPALPNVLLIGDSISIGYTIPVREALQGEANVFRPATNCGPTTRGVEQIDRWLGDRQWDVVYFNFGLHDLKYMEAESTKLADPNDPASRQQVPLMQYTANLKRIAERLKETGATVIWCPTTPIPQGAQGRVPGDEVRYNAAAAKALNEVGGIEFSELYTHAVKNAISEQRKADVHFTERGSKLLADHVAETIRQALAKQDGAKADKTAQPTGEKSGKDKPLASDREVTGDAAATDAEATRPEANDNEPEPSGTDE